MKILGVFREAIIKKLCRLLSTSWGYRLIARTLEKEECLILKKCSDHYIAFHPNDLIGKEIFFHGSFQRQRTTEVIEKVKSQHICTPGGLLLEIGANIGTQTVYSMKSGFFNGAIAIEPDSKNFPVLKLNLKINNLMHFVRTFQVAVGDKFRPVKILRQRFNSGASRTSPVGGHLADETDAVDMIPVDDILHENGIPIKDIALVWMDVEGYEKYAIAGMRSLIALETPIYFEYTSSAFSSNEAEAFWDMLEDSYQNVFLHSATALERTSFSFCRNLERQVDILLF